MWLSSNMVWILLAVTPGGATSWMGVYTTLGECREAAAALEVQLPLRTECRREDRRR